MNSFKTNSGISKSLFAFPNSETFYGLKSYITGMFFGNYPFWKTIVCSFFITIGGVVLILFCTSMCAWYLQRSNTIICKIIYFFCIFSMVVPFQMVMFTLSKTADSLKLNTPWGILIIYLGFGAGLAVFMFSGFVKSIPIEIEEAADVDGAGPLRTFFGIVLPIMKPTFISVAILETMWIWNDYLLPYLILDKKYRTIPIHIQYLNGSYGHTDTSAIMALIVLSIVPIVIFYFACQKYIIEGVVAGAVKG
jgi:raffinose/stachyose/melibiose transport system permease protein